MASSISSVTGATAAAPLDAWGADAAEGTRPSFCSASSNAVNASTNDVGNGGGVGAGAGDAGGADEVTCTTGAVTWMMGTGGAGGTGCATGDGCTAGAAWSTGADGGGGDTAAIGTGRGAGGSIGG